MKKDIHPELKHQMYGGDISDYYIKNKQNTSPAEDNKNIADIYKQITNKNNPLNLPDNLKNKIKVIS